MTVSIGLGRVTQNGPMDNSDPPTGSRKGNEHPTYIHSSCVWHRLVTLPLSFQCRVKVKIIMLRVSVMG